jgi:hypothetical protein
VKPTSFATIVIATLLAVGGAVWIGASEPPRRKPYPKPTPPPPASPIYHDVKEPAPDAEEIARLAREHDDMLVLEVERALAARDPQRRETVFTFLLPELIQVAPQRLAALCERQKGEAREVLRTELAQQWITRDRDAAIRWMKSLPDEAERRDSAMAAVRTLASVAPNQAIYVADQFGVGRDDGYLERMVQVWAEENIRQAENWLATQPGGPKTDQLRSRIEQVRGRKKAS